MRTAVVESVCECQARLGAEIDEQRRVVRGWGRKKLRSAQAPAIATGLSLQSFNVGWACPFCGRNTLRPFDTNALVFQEKPAPQEKPSASLPPGSRPAPRSLTPTSG
ncbi:MAG TPA: hypothetical protein VLJ38_20160 [Polyangiaceae bacterium]|nr:hypothetical protein [Polyangiaceae bacterium]